MKFNFQMNLILLSTLLTMVFFQNCSKTMFNQGNSDTELTLATPDSNDNNDLAPITKSESAGTIVFRPNCFQSITVDYDSYCRVSVSGGMHVTGASLNIDRVPSCEIVSNGQSIRLHLLGPEMIGQEVNGGAMFLNYKDYMTKQEYDASARPCDLAIERAANQQNTQAREQAEMEWGEKAAAALYETFKTKNNVYNFENNVMANFPGNFFSRDTFYSVHCVWAEQVSGSSECGTAAMPRWINAPQKVKEKFVKLSEDDPGLEDELEFRHYCKHSNQCQL